MRKDLCTDHPNYGKVVHTPDGRIVCHICGRAFVKLGAHIVQKHEMTSKEYKRIYGLDVGKGLITAEHKAHLKDCVMRNYDVVVTENLVKRGHSTRFVIGCKGRTREMISEQTRLRFIQNIIDKNKKKMSDLFITKKEIGDYRISVYYSESEYCPITSYDMAARYLFEYVDNHSRHVLHKECNWKDWFYDNRHSLEDALRCIASSTVCQDDLVDYIKKKNVDGLRLTYNEDERVWELQTECGYGAHKGEWETQLEITSSDLRNCDYKEELLEQLDADDLIAVIENCADNFVIKEWSSTGYCQGDYLSGVAYMSKERYDKMVGDTGKDWKEHASELIDAEVKDIGMWVWGDVIGFVLERKVEFEKVYADENYENEKAFEWKVVDTSWGYYMEPDELIEQVVAEYGLTKESANN